MDTALATQLGIAALALRMMCGLFYIPHILFKVLSHHKAVDFFAKAGFVPARAFVVLAAVVESTCAAGLIFGIYPAIAAALSTVILIIAAVAIVAVGGLGWNWSLGGVEYPVFWAFVSSVVLVLHWN